MFVPHADSSATLVVLFALLTLSVLWTRTRTAASLPVPPGPKPLPLVGNLFDMPTKNMAPTLRKLTEKYGDIVYLNVFGQPTVVIGSYDAAVELLDVKSANTSDRPRLVMGELAGLLWQFSVMRYSPHWRKYRRTFHEFFHQGAVPQYRPTQAQEARRFLKKLLATPDDFLAHARLTIGASILSVIYGVEVAEKDDKHVRIAERGANIFSEVVVPGRYLVELFPALAYVPSWLPGAKFKRDAAAWKKDLDTLRNDPYNAAVEAMAKGDARPSVTSTLVGNALGEDGRLSTEDEEYFKDVTGVAYAAGADTTLSTLTIFFLKMVVHRDIQQRAQAELDEVVGPSRLPDFSDRDSLPYVNAVLKECSRWHSVIPLGIPHRAVEEDVYNGCLIPRGSVLIPNLWAMSRDPIAYPEPEKFVPERFLKDGMLDPDVRDPFKVQFGFGRRVCPGRHFSSDAMFIIVASVLHTFDIRPPTGSNGKPLQVDPKIPLDHTLSHAEPFACVITPRSTKAEALIREQAGLSSY